MTLFRKKVGEETLARLGGGLPMSKKALGETIGRVPSAVNPSEEDGDGDGFRTGRDGRDNIPVTKPAEDAVKELWSDKRQNALKKDEERVAGVIKKLKGRKPKYTIAQINEIIAGAKSREDVVTARKAARELAKSLFELDGIGENGEYTTRLFKGKTGVGIFGRKRGMLAAHEDHPYPHIAMNGEILDKKGNKVGMFNRIVYLTNENAAKKPHVYHEYLRVDNELKGKGIGGDFTLATEMLYKEMGAEEIHLNAALADGAYTWLRAGYNFKTDADRIKLAIEIEKRYKQMLADAGSKEKLVAGGFKTTAGRHFTDGGDAGSPVMMPAPLAESVEELNKFLKILGQLKTHKVGSENQLPPMALTMFGQFSKRILKGADINVKKYVGSPDGQKSLKIYGFDKLFTRV
jgi:hypothetical protein